MIEKFEIIGFAGDRDIRIDFSEPIKILIVDNGAGKTTVLNSLHAFLAERWDKLLQVDFEAMRLSFANGKVAEINRENLVPFAEQSELFAHPAMSTVWKTIPNNTLVAASKRPTRSVAAELAKRYELPISLLHTVLRRMKHGIDSESPQLSQAANVISESFPYRLLFLPTYRRIEEELTSLGSDVDLPSIDADIQFGMADVQQRINEITATIRKASLEAVTAISGEVMNQLIAGLSVSDDMRELVNNREAVEIVLARSGSNILEENKDKLLRMIGSEELSKAEYEPLVYFLSALVRIYEQQKEYDEAIKAFSHVCNNYLVNKQIVYDESSVDLHVSSQLSGQKDIPLHRLSSGEKQIVSLFSKLYLENVDVNDQPFAIFFDEPELSLSIDWQKSLLPDVVGSKRCGFLFCTTHSPFIFDNDLDQYAIGLDRYISYYD